MDTILLRKMDWQPEEKSGRNEESEKCTFEYWQPDVELNKRNRVLEQHNKQKAEKASKPLVTVTKYKQWKHPVSLLGEYCSKGRCDAPMYELCLERGPDHKKYFLFKVTVNQVDYKPAVASCSKKKAKALAAQTCLQALGILPKPDSKIVKKP